MAASKRIERNAEHLKDMLINNSGFDSEKPVNDILRNDLLSHIMKNHSANRKELLKSKYLNSKTIKEGIIKIHDEILNDNHPRQTFGPGTFTGIQGQLNCVILTKNIIEKKLGWSLVEVVNKMNYDVLYSYKLRCTKTCFGHIYDLIMACYPEANLKPYYFKKAAHVWRTSDGKRNDALIKEAIREFVEVLINPKGKYKYKLKRMPQWINYKMFREPVLPYDTNLSYMLSSCFGNSHIKAIMFAYPELKLKPYYFSNVPNNYWSGEKGIENAKEVMNELIDILTNPKGEYKLSKEEVRDLFKFKTYGKPILPYRKNMRGMLQTLFNNSPSAPFELISESKNN